MATPPANSKGKIAQQTMQDQKCRACVTSYRDQFTLTGALNCQTRVGSVLGRKGKVRDLGPNGNLCHSGTESFFFQGSPCLPREWESKFFIFFNVNAETIEGRGNSFHGSDRRLVLTALNQKKVKSAKD